MLSKQQITNKLSTVQDPELHLDIITLGLVYDTTIKDDGGVHVLLTLTTPLCPFGPLLIELIETAIRELGAPSVDVELTFDPPWKPPQNLREMMGV